MFHFFILAAQQAEEAVARTRIVHSGKISECLWSTRLFSDDLPCGSAGQHDEQIPEPCVQVLIHWRTWYPLVCVRCPLSFFDHSTELKVNH